MEINAEKTKLMTNNSNGKSTVIRISGEKLETVNTFKYLGVGAIAADEGSKPEILSTVIQTTATLTKLKAIWKDGKLCP
ncbi:hypothetical protein PoB_000186400 [Plakobranchus ocellatus]|uniref:Uncharacterized protein n=1 Tax=Plakobranchus ocellatus TaxID=259542 RepID=A0AAV3XWX4_9GAST|nr:hypothetical protein PoB_000186400 [Plakobranchus ocellatus]